MSHLSENNANLLARVRRIAGQVGGIERAMQNDSGCSEILHLVAGVRGAVNGLMNELIESHLRHHVIGDEVEVNEVELDEFLKLLKRYT